VSGERARASAPAQASDAGVQVRSDAGAVAFLQRNQALAATLDAGIVLVAPEHRDSRTVISHELAHIAQLRSGLTVSRAESERAADDFTRGVRSDVGGAAAPPLFQSATSITQPPYTPNVTERSEAEVRDLGELGTPTPGARQQVGITAGNLFGEQTSGVEYHVQASGAGRNGTVESRTDVVARADRRQRYGTRTIGPGQGPSTGIVVNPEGTPVPVAPAPTDHPPLYPIVLTYRRSIHLTDRDGRSCDVTISSTLQFSYETWVREATGRPRTFETLLSLRGDDALTEVTVEGRSAVQPYYAVTSNFGRSIDIQSILTEQQLAVGSAFLGGSGTTATFVRPDQTAGQQFTALESMLAALDAKEIARRVEAERARREALGWFGRLLEDTGLAQAIDAAARSLGDAADAVIRAINDFWSSLPPSVRGVLEAIGEAVAVFAVILAAAAIIVELAPVEIAIGAVMLVIGGLLLAYAFGSALIARTREALGVGLYDPQIIVGVALMDAVGLGALIEALTDRSIISNRALNRGEEQRYRAGTGGVIQLIMTVLGVRGLLRGGAGPEAVPRETLTERGPAEPIGTRQQSAPREGTGSSAEGRAADPTLEINEGNITSPETTRQGGRRYIEGRRVPERSFNEPRSGMRRLDADDIPRRPGETRAQAVARVRDVIGRRISDTPLRPIWDRVVARLTNGQPVESLGRERVLDVYARAQGEFWTEVANDPAASRFLRDAGIDFEPGSRAPLVQVNDPAAVPWFERKINLDHVLEKAIGDNWTRALDPTNLEFQPQGPNVYRETVQQRHPDLRGGAD
jgi:hypothetical protein